MLEIFFVTRNPKKVAVLEPYINRTHFKIVREELSVIEPQADTVRAISLSKAMQAFELLKKPLIVEDSGFYIDGLQGFPGPYTKYILEAIGIEGILRLAQPLSARSCRFVSVLTYIDSDGVPRTFEDNRDNGMLALSAEAPICEEAWSEIWRVFIPENFSEPLSLMKGKEKEAALQNWFAGSSFGKFAQWLSEKVNPLTSDGNPEMRLLSNALEFPIPRERISIRPREHGAHKLIVYHREKDLISHHRFEDIVQVLPEHTLVVVNNSKVVKAALRKPSDDGTYIHIIYPQRPDLDEVYALCPWKPEVGASIAVKGGVYKISDAPVPGRDIRCGTIIPDDSSLRTLQAFLERNGDLPIPIYINSERGPDRADKRDYQNCYAKIPGSIECPTAGLHFYPELMDQLRKAGKEILEVTLHIGYGTWKSFKNRYVDEHQMDPEEIQVDSAALKRLQQALQNRHPILAVGTSVVRTLESIASELLSGTAPEDHIQRETDLFIYPGYQFQIVNMLLTNFAYPRTPIMSLAATFCDVETLKKIYREALEKDYLFYSYGDAILIL